jgi:hypothetical protein
MEVPPWIMVGPTKFPFGYSSGGEIFRPSRMILPPSSSADVISAITLCFAAGDIRGPLGGKVSGEHKISRMVPNSQIDTLLKASVYFKQSGPFHKSR